MQNLSEAHGILSVPKIVLVKSSWKIKQPGIYQKKDLWNILSSKAETKYRSGLVGKETGHPTHVESETDLPFTSDR